MAFKKVLSFLITLVFFSSCSDFRSSQDFSKINADTQKNITGKSKLTQLSNFEIRYGGDIYKLEKKISKRVKIYQYGQKKILHATASIDTSKKLVTSFSGEDFFTDSGLYFITRNFSDDSNNDDYYKPVTGDIGYFYNSNTDEKYIYRLTAGFDNISFSSPVDYTEVEVEINRTNPGFRTRSGMLALSLVDPAFLNSPESKSHYDFISSGSPIGEVNFDANDATLNPLLPIDTDTTLNKIENYISSNNDRLFVGIKSASENSGGAYADIGNTIELVIAYDEIGPEVTEAKYEYYSEPPPPGETLPFKWTDIKLEVSNWPADATLLHVIYDSRITSGDLGYEINSNQISITGRINKSNPLIVTCESAESTDLSNRLVYKDASGQTQFIEISNWNNSSEDIELLPNTSPCSSGWTLD